MRGLQIAIAWLISVAGLLMPWRVRILFSELLGWIAQLVPPQLYQLEAVGDEDPPEAGDPDPDPERGP